jgi:tRNA(Ile)-lysidine synthase
LNVTSAAPAWIAQCHFPVPGTAVDLAVSGGPDSLGLLLLAVEAQLVVTVHHVDHHARSTSGQDAQHVQRLCGSLGVAFVRHDVVVVPGGNFESRARAQRRQVMPQGVLTGHTMDDLVETMLLNMLRGAGIDGLSPMVDDPTKPLRDIRRSTLHHFVASSGHVALHDETNDSPDFRRNRVRHELLPVMQDVAGRDVVPLLARQASLVFEERRWLDQLSANDDVTLSQADCRELSTWPKARLWRWLRRQLRSVDEGDGEHPPSADEVSRCVGVVCGEFVATQLSGGRRLSRSGQHLTLE